MAFAGVAGDGRGQVVVYYVYLIPFRTRRFMGDLGHQLLAFRKGRKKNLLGEKGRRQGTGDSRASTPPYQQSPSPAHPPLSPGNQICICGSNDPASGPCGQSRSRPVIKMKWAADPMVPFRRVEHWPRDLYLIDQPVQREKSSFPPESLVPHSTALFQSKCLCENRKKCFLTPLIFTSCVGIVMSCEI